MTSPIVARIAEQFALVLAVVALAGTAWFVVGDIRMSARADGSVVERSHGECAADFTVGGRSYRAHSLGGGRRMPDCPFGVGDAVEVRYDPGAPDRSRIDVPSQRAVLYAAGAIGCPGLLLGWWTLRGRRRPPKAWPRWTSRRRGRRAAS